MPSGSNLVTHGGYAVDRLLRTDGLDGRSTLGRRRRRLRMEYGLALGYPSWTVVPAPARAAIDNVIRQQLLAERLFAAFWSGEEPAKRFDTVSENLRRQLSDLGLEPRAAPLDVAAALAAMREGEQK